MRIAIVEDDPQQLERVEASLRNVFEVLQITAFTNAHEFLATLTAFETSPPDLFLFDVMLPWRAPESLAPPPAEGWDASTRGD